MSRPFEMEGIADTALRALCLYIPCTFENEGVVAVGRVRVALAQRMVHENRALQLTPQQQRHVECRVLMGTYGGAHPIQHELAGLGNGVQGRMRGDTLGEMVGKQVGSKHAEQRASTRGSAKSVPTQGRPRLLPVNDSALHHEPHGAQSRNIGGGIALYGHQIGQQSRRHASELVLTVHDAGIHARGGLERLNR